MRQARRGLERSDRLVTVSAKANVPLPI